MRHVIFGSILLLSLHVVACSEEGGGAYVPSAPASDAVTDTLVADASLDVPDENTPSTSECPDGQVLGMNSSCITIGIPDCAELFMNADSGFCEPSVALCEAGHYPDFETGCVQAGIAQCAPEFVDAESGLCIASPDLCEPGFMAIPTLGCVSLDPPDGCGEGTWGNIVETPGDQHVDQAYTGGSSDGSRANPWTQLNDAKESLPTQGRIIVAAGDYDESVFFQSSSSLIGRCSSMVTVSGATNSPIAANLGKTVLEVGGAHDVTLRDLRVSGDGVGLAAYFGAQVTLERVVFDDNEFFGLFINGSGTAVTATDLMVNATRPQADGMFGLGVAVQDGASFSLERGVVANNTDANLFCGGSVATELSEMTVKNALISGARDASHGIYGGRGVSVGNGATATLENTILRENSASNLMVYGTGTSVTANGLVILGADSSDTPFHARGINLQEGATGQLNQVAISRVEEIGLYVANDGTDLEVKALYITDTQPTGSQTNGRAIHIRDGAVFSLEGGALIANHDTGFVVRENATASVTGLLVENTLPDVLGWGGTGIEVLGGGHLVLERSALLTNIEAGLLSILDNTLVELRDSIIAHTQKAADGAFGRGIQSQLGASIIVERSVIINNHEAAIFIWEGFGEIRDTLLADTRVSGNSDLGDGLLVTMSEVIAQGVSSTRNGRVGILFDQALGEISNCSITENALGLATQGADRPTVSDDNAVVDNTKNVVENNDLAIPSTPMDLPEHDSLNE